LRLLGCSFPSIPSPFSPLQMAVTGRDEDDSGVSGWIPDLSIGRISYRLHGRTTRAKDLAFSTTTGNAATATRSKSRTMVAFALGFPSTALPWNTLNFTFYSIQQECSILHRLTLVGAVISRELSVQTECFSRVSISLSFATCQGPRIRSRLADSCARS
jgi:hypothetical protein